MRYLSERKKEYYAMRGSRKDKFTFVIKKTYELDGHCPS